MCESQNRYECGGKGVFTATGGRRPVVQPIATLLTEVSRHIVRSRRYFEICTLVRYYAAFRGNYSQTFPDNLFKDQELQNS
jgi:hypothetical protein